jgi:hypothetical protein
MLLSCLQLKRTFFAKLCNNKLDDILVEIKGSDLRKQLRGNRNEQRHFHIFTSKLLAMLNNYNVKLSSVIWVKQVGVEFHPIPVYTKAIQMISETFNHYLDTMGSYGLEIADSRNSKLNSQVAHSLYTVKYAHVGDTIPRITEPPLFGHSENHAMIQITDLIVSCLLFPMSVYAYCSPTSIHHHQEYGVLKEKYGAQLKNMQYRFQKPVIKNNIQYMQWTGGIQLRTANKYLDIKNMLG